MAWLIHGLITEITFISQFKKTTHFIIYNKVDSQGEAVLLEKSGSFRSAFAISPPLMLNQTF